MAKLVNLGSLCIDYVYAVPRIGQSGETIASTDRKVFAGGKGLNQSLAAANAGSEVMHFGAVGADGELLLESLAAQNVDFSGVKTIAEASGHAFIQVDPAGQNSIVIHGGANRRITNAHVAEALAAVGQDGWLLLQNEINDLSTTIKAAAKRDIAVALNLAPADERIADYPYELLRVLIVNELEGIALSEAADSKSAFLNLVERWPHVHIVMTLGSHGAWAWDADERHVFQVGTFSVQAVDETAAGDAYVGFFMAALARRAGLREGLIEGAAAGALAVTKAGAAPSIPSAADVARMTADQSVDLKATNLSDF